jgi:FkbM family methyltransferase
MFNFEYIRRVGIFKWIYKTFIRQFHKRVFRRPHVIRLPSGAVFRRPLESHLASEVYVSGADIDNGSEALFYALLPVDACMYDVGANVGYYSVYMSPKVSRCYAFEPDPRSAELLRLAIVNYTKVVHVPCAVSSSCGEATFYQHSQMEVSGLGIGAAGNAGLRVKVVTLDDFKENEGGARKVDAIKIDVEGFDFEVIKGARGIMEVDRPVIVTEAYPSEEFINYVRLLDYSIFGFVRIGRYQSTLREIAIAGEFVCKMIFLIHNSQVAGFKQTAGYVELS